jgi:hypothetical protein
MFEVEAVITWVDGADPLHRAKRERHLALAQADAVARAAAFEQEQAALAAKLEVWGP